MRSASAGELLTLAKAEREVTVRIRVANGSGTMVDLSHWVDSCSIDHDVDQPVSGATVSFVRSQGDTRSLAPLREDSILNRLNDGVTYSPILDLNRAITIEASTADIGGNGDFKMMFEGTIDIVNWEQDPVTVSCRDGMADLVDRWIEDATFYSTTPVGTPLEDIMEEIADDVFGVGVEPVYTPVSPAYDIVKYQQQEMSVADAWTDLIQLRGLDIREKWHDGTSSFRHTLYEPDRTKTVPDYTFTPNKYLTVSQLSLELTNIRNVVQVSYRNSANLGNRAKVTVSDSASITKYKRRFFRMQEADTSPIDTSAEATTMADAALADLKDPKAEQEVEMPFFWPAELGDLYRYSDNRVHYNTDQDWAVVEIKHVFAYQKHRTILKVRGSVAGQYATWLGRGGSMGGPTNGTTGQAFAPYPFIVPLNTEGSDATWDLRFNAINGTGGGGTNLTYTIKSKKTFGTETTLVGPDAPSSALPDDVTITRDLKQDQVITFTVKDAATGMFAAETFVVPAYVPSIGATGNLVGSYLDAASVTKDKTEVRLRCSVLNGVNQSIPNTTLTNLTFNGELYDVGTLHDTSTNTDRITVPTGGDVGNWFVSATVAFAANATGRREVRLYQRPSGAGPSFLLAETIIPGLSDGGVGPSVTISSLTNTPPAADFFVVQVWQNSTAALNVLAAGTQFSAMHLW